MMLKRVFGFLLCLAIVVSCAPGWQEPPKLERGQPPSDAALPAGAPEPEPTAKTPPEPPQAPMEDVLLWRDFTNETADLSLKTKRMMMVYLYADWCPYCKMMDDETFSDPKIIELLNTKFVPVKVDGDKHPNVIEQIADGKATYPSTVFIYPDTNADRIVRVGNVPGFIPADDYLSLLLVVLMKKEEVDKLGGIEAAEDSGAIEPVTVESDGPVSE